MTQDEIKLAIEIGSIIVAAVSGYFYIRNKSDNNSKDITTLRDDFDEHCKQTTTCNKNFENIRIDINKLQTEEHMKSEYQSQMVEKILSPIIKDLTDSMKLYIDQKHQILTNEIKVYQADNNEFKKEIKDYIKELKDENKSSIKELIEVIKTQNTKTKN